MRQGVVQEIARVVPFAQEAGQFPSVCTIQRISGTLDGLGAEVMDFADVTGLVNIPCHVSPPSVFKLSGSNEYRKVDRISEKQEFHVLLAGNFPGIQMKDRAVIDGQAWNIVGADHDAFNSQTRLEVQEYFV